MTIQTIGIVGAGAWGTALAQVARQAGRDVLIWAYEAQAIAGINDRHENCAWLPGVALDSAITATDSLARIASCDAVLLATPAQHLRAAGAGLAPHLDAGKPVAICAKGIEQETGELLTQVLRGVLPQAIPAVLSGPSFAREVARGMPTAVTLACAEEPLGKALAHTMRHRTFRPYWTDDLIGAQIGGAIKNVLAIAAGIVVGRELGASAHAALTARGFAEMTRFGQALGARPETMSGLSGLGDLILTCSSPQSRNMSLGLALGRGEALADILKARTSVTEGVYTASAMVELARAHAVDLPISAAVHDILAGKASVREAIGELLARPLRAET